MDLYSKGFKMPNGKLGSANLVALTDTVIYTVPLTGIDFAAVNIDVCNNSSTAALINIAITSDATPDTKDYIENGTYVQSKTSGGGVLRITGEFMSPGEKIVVHSTNDNVSVRVHGLEEPV
jgi:hypothetical protein